MTQAVILKGARKNTSFLTLQTGTVHKTVQLYPDAGWFLSGAVLTRLMQKRLPHPLEAPPPRLHMLQLVALQTRPVFKMCVTELLVPSEHLHQLFSAIASWDPTYKSNNACIVCNCSKGCYFVYCMHRDGYIAIGSKKKHLHRNKAINYPSGTPTKTNIEQ